MKTRVIQDDLDELTACEARAEATAAQEQSTKPAGRIDRLAAALRARRLGREARGASGARIDR